MFISDNKEDKLLISKAFDAVKLSELRHKPCFLGFLNEREAYIVKNHLSTFGIHVAFYGGYSEALRTIMCSCEYDVDLTEYPILPLYFSFRESESLTHRDFLGVLMSLGIDRSCVGDIIVNKGVAVCFLKSEIYDFVKNSILKIGRTGVKILDKKPDKLDLSKSFEDMTVMVSSLRIDVVVASLTGLSRGKTSNLILSGKVFHNYLPSQNVSAKVSDNDIISISGYGKYIIGEQTGLTKKGRIKLIIKHYR